MGLKLHLLFAYCCCSWNSVEGEILVPVESGLRFTPMLLEVR
jgi:hypothetical protein